MTVEEMEIVDVKFSAHRADYDYFMAVCEKHGFDDTEMFFRIMNHWRILEEKLYDPARRVLCGERK